MENTEDNYDKPIDASGRLKNAILTRYDDDDSEDD